MCKCPKKFFQISRKSPKYLELLCGKINPSVLIGSFLVGILPYGPSRVFFCFKRRQIYLQLKLVKETCKIPYSFEWKKTTMNQLIARQMREFSDSLPASELEHFWLSMFNYFRKYICVHASSINLMEKRTRQQQFPIFFTESFSLFISVTKKFSFNILKTVKFKNRKENQY